MPALVLKKIYILLKFNKIYDYFHIFYITIEVGKIFALRTCQPNY